MKSRDESRKEGERLFKILAAPDSGIRAFSEAVRNPELPKSPPTPAQEAATFERGLPHAIERLGRIAKRSKT